MEAASSSDVLIATHKLVSDFLKRQGYRDTLAAFERESDSLHSLKSKPQVDGTLDDIISGRLSRQLAKASLEQSPLVGQLDKLKLNPKQLPLEVVQTILDSTNILLVQQGVLPARSWDTAVSRFQSSLTPCFFTSAVDRSVKAYSVQTHDLLATFNFPSPVLSLCLQARFLIAVTMQGSLHVIDLVTRDEQVSLKDHSKYVTRVVTSPDGRFVATLGYDKLIHIYEAHIDLKAPDEALLEGEEHDSLAYRSIMRLKQVHTVTLQTNPESAVFLPSSSHLVYGARDDCMLHYLQLSDWSEQQFNLNENRDTWVSFSPLYMSIHPTLEILAISTSGQGRVLLYPFSSERRLRTLYTNAAQSDYFQPRHRWLPDGNGLIVNSEDGIVRIVDLAGKVREYGAHGAASIRLEHHEGEDLSSERARVRKEQEQAQGSSVIKDVEAIRCDESGKLILVSVGFDKSIRLAA